MDTATLPASVGAVRDGALTLADGFGIGAPLTITEIDLTDRAVNRTVLRGRTRLLGMDVAAKLTVTTEPDGSHRTVLLAKLPTGWRPADTYPALAKAPHAALLTSLVLSDAVVRLGRRAGSVTDDEFGLAGEEIADGLSVSAAALQWTSDLPAPAAAHARRHGTFRTATAALALDEEQPYLTVGLWWDAAPGGVLNATESGFSLWASLDETRPRSSLAALEGFTTATTGFGLLTRDLDRTPAVWHLGFPEARPLGGLDALSGLWGGGSRSDLLPTSDQPTQPELRLHELWLEEGAEVRARLELTLPTGGDYPWTGFGGRVTLESVEATATIPVGAARTGRLEMIGAGRLFDTRWLMRVDTQEGVEAQLLAPETVKPTDLLQRLVDGLGLDLPDVNLGISHARAAISKDFADRSFLVALDGDVELIPGALTLTGILLSIDVVGGTLADRTFLAELKLGSLPFSVGATRAAAASGWSLSAVAKPDADATLANLVHWIADAFGAEVPVTVPDIALTDLTFTYDTGTKDAAFTAAARWTPPADLPMGGNEVDVELLVRSERDPATGRRQAGFQITWSTERFTVEAGYFNRSVEVFASWESGEKPTGLAALTTGTPALGDSPLPADGAWDGFPLERAVIAFASEPKRVELAADVRLGPGLLVLDAALVSPEGRRLRAEWQANPGSTVSLNELLDALGIDDALGLPSGLLPGEVNDFFSLDRLGVAYHEKPYTTFAAVAGLAKGSLDAFVVAARPGGRWGVAAGVAVRDMAKFRELVPDLVDDVLDALALEPRWFALSSIPQPTALPDGLGTGNHGEVREGLTLAAAFAPKTSRNDVMKALCEVVALDRLDVAAHISRSGFDLQGRIEGEVAITVPLAGKLTLSSPYLEIGTKGVAPQVSLGGTAAMDLFGEPRRVQLSLSAAVDSLRGGAKVSGLPFPRIQTLPGLHIHDDYAVELGVTYAPTGMRFGLVGTYHVGNDPAKYHGDIGIVLNLDGGVVPDPLYVYATADRWDLWSHFELAFGIATRLDDARSAAAAAGQVVSDAKDVEQAFGWLLQQYTNLQTIFEKISFRDVSFHWCRQPVTLPDGSAVLPGIGFRGTLDLFGFKAFAALEFSTASGFTLNGHLECDPIDVRGLLKVSGDGKGVSRAAATSDQWMTPPPAANPSATVSPPAMVIKPGGPVLHVSSGSAPFLHANLQVTLFEFANVAVTAEIDTSGYHFLLEAGLGDLVKIRLGSSLSVKDGVRFAAEGRIDLVLRGDIDLLVTTISIDSGFAAEVKLVISDTEFTLDVGGTFRFQGNDIRLPSFTLSVAPASIGALAGIVWGRIVDAAGELFAGVLRALEEAWKAVEAAVEQAALAVAEAATQAVEEVAKAAEEAFDEMGRFGQNVAGAAAELMGSAAGAIASVAEDAFNGVVAVGAEAVEALFGVASEVGAAVADAANAVAGAVSDAANAVAAGVTEAYDTVANGVTDAADAVASGVSDAAEAVGDAVGDAAEAVGDAVGDAAEAVGDAVGDAAGAVGDAMGGAVETVGNFFSDLGIF